MKNVKMTLAGLVLVVYADTFSRKARWWIPSDSHASRALSCITVVMGAPSKGRLGIFENIVNPGFEGSRIRAVRFHVYSKQTSIVPYQFDSWLVVSAMAMICLRHSSMFDDNVL